MKKKERLKTLVPIDNCAIENNLYSKQPIKVGGTGSEPVGKVTAYGTNITNKSTSGGGDNNHDVDKYDDKGNFQGTINLCIDL